jgi:hypothetical protein
MLADPTRPGGAALASTIHQGGRLLVCLKKELEGRADMG